MLYYILFNTNQSAIDLVIDFIITFFVYIVSMALHEFAHAYVAYKNGDLTAKIAGRMTLNPFSHLSVSGLLMFIFLGVGWAKPVPINPLNFKKYKKGMRQVAISGVCVNFLLGLISAIIYGILLATVGLNSGAAMTLLYNVLLYFMVVNSFLVMFNILPVPPMDGYNFISTFLKNDSKFAKFVQKYSFRIIIGVLLIGSITDLLFGQDIFRIYLELLYEYIFKPIITLIGVL